MHALMREERELERKRLLVLGGTSQQIKFVEAAHGLGVYTIVTDYLIDSPAKSLADKSFDVDIVDTSAVVSLAREEHVDGVICGYIDPAQRPYQQICDQLGCPCYGNAEQFRLMTDKRAFKQLCADYGVGTIREYSLEDVASQSVVFPVFVKPADSRGSRGQSVCTNYHELESAIATARSESSSGELVIEQYLSGKQEFQVTYFFIDGEPYIIRTADSYVGSVDNHMEKVVVGAISPSRFTSLYVAKAHDRVVRMLKGIGLHDGPAFMQGFIMDDDFYFFDPGLRFPGVDFERIIKRVYGIDFAEAMVVYALTGSMPKLKMPQDMVFLKGQMAAVLFPTITAGVISGLDCFDRMGANDHVVSLIPRVEAGQRVEWAYDINQRLAEIDLLAAGPNDLASAIAGVQAAIDVVDDTGKSMVFELFDQSLVLNAYPCLNSKDNNGKAS